MTRPALSTRQASRKTADAADQLLEWLKQQGGFPDGSGDGRAGPGHSAYGGAEASNPAPSAPSIPADAARGLGEFPGQAHEIGQGLVRRAERTDNATQMPPPQHTDWLHHRLLAAGPAGTLADFRAAARGAGTVPWRLDLDRTEEDLFLMLAAPPSPQRRRLSLASARVLAGQLRTAAERRHAAAVGRVGRSQACALDLHALVPVPPGVLQLGPDHPDALAWLWAHWGTTVALRHVSAGPVLPRRPDPDDPAAIRLAFWSADWTPWRALATVRARWPALRFDVRPTYDPL